MILATLKTIAQSGRGSQGWVVEGGGAEVGGGGSVGGLVGGGNVGASVGGITIVGVGLGVFDGWG